MQAEGHSRLPGLARESIEAGFSRRLGPATPPELDTLPAALAVPAATFVTLSVEGSLRGCRGTIEAARPLAHDLWRNAWASAFDDPRFAPLERAEFTVIEIDVSLLSPLEPVPASSEAILLEQLVPHVHGLVLASGEHRATFLPKVWESLPDPSRFIAELKVKAGLPRQGWPGALRAWRYTTERVPPAG